MTDLSPSQPRTEWTPQRRELHRRLTDRSESLGELYAGALEILTLRLPGRVRFVGHAVREIRNRLPEVVAAHQTPPRVDTNHLDGLATLWKHVILPMSADSRIASSMPATVAVPLKVARAVDDILRTHAASRQTKREVALKLFAAISVENHRRGSAIEPVVAQWLKVTDFFMAKTHDTGRHPDGHLDHDEFVRQFELFELGLGSILNEFYSNLSGLDDILDDANR